MTLIDSTAAFEKRCDELRAGLKDFFSASFVTTFSELAFAVGTPQSPVSDAVMQRFADNLLGGHVPLVIVQSSRGSTLRRLLW